MELDESFESVIYRVSSECQMPVREFFKSAFDFDLPEQWHWETVPAEAEQTSFP